MRVLVMTDYRTSTLGWMDLLNTTLHLVVRLRSGNLKSVNQNSMPSCPVVPVKLGKAV